MTETKTKSAVANIQELQKVYERLSDDDRERLAQAGVSIPRGDLAAISSGEHKWGLRCNKCNRIALYFIGDKWQNGDQVVDVPPTLPDIAWTQHLPPHEIDRHTPRCQHCGITVPQLGSGAFDYGRVIDSATSGRSRLVIVADFEASRDKAFSKANVNKFKRDQGNKTVDMSDLSHSYNKEYEKASEVIDKKHGAGTSAGIEQVAAATGAADYVAKGHGV